MNLNYFFGIAIQVMQFNSLVAALQYHPAGTSEISD